MNVKEQKNFLLRRIEESVKSSLENRPEELELKNLLIEVELEEEILPEVLQYFQNKKWKVNTVGTTVYLS